MAWCGWRKRHGIASGESVAAQQAGEADGAFAPMVCARLTCNLSGLPASLTRPSPAAYPQRWAADGCPMKTLVVGLGNPILGDDGVGWRVAEEVKRLIADGEWQMANGDAPSAISHQPSAIKVDCFALGG